MYVYADFLSNPISVIFYIILNSGGDILKKKLLVIGAAGVRLTLKCDRLPYADEMADGTKYAYSPDTLGAAAALASARMGTDAVLLCRVGPDANGSKLISMLSELGVDTRYAVKDRNLPTSLAVVIEESEAGSRTISYKSASENLTPADVEEGFNSYPDSVLLRLEGSKSAAEAAEKFAEIKDTPLFISADRITDRDSVYLPKKGHTFIADARSMLTLTGVAPSNSESSLRAAIELTRHCSLKNVIFRMNGGSIYVYDGRYGRILDKNSKGLSFTDVFAPAFVSEYLRCGNVYASSKFAISASSLWEACGETLDTVPTASEVRRDAEL